MTACACGTPDRVPVAPFGCGRLPHDSAILAELIHRTDFIASVGGAGTSFLGAASGAVSVAEGNRTVTTIPTRYGELRRIVTRTDITAATTAFPCRTADDIEKLLSIPYEPVAPDPAAFNQWKDRIGEEGVVLCGCIDPICVPAEFFSPEDFCFLWIDAPEAMRALVEVAQQRILESLEAACRAGIDAYRIIGGEYASTQLGPQAFRELVVGPDRRMCDLMHAHGALAYNHNHGPLMDYLSMLIEIDMDACDCFEAPPWGDTDLPKAKEALKSEVCIVGNLDDMEVIDKLSEAEVRAIARQRIQEAGPDGFVLGGTASGTYTERAARNFMAMAEVSAAMARA